MCLRSKSAQLPRLIPNPSAHHNNCLCFHCIRISREATQHGDFHSQILYGKA